jgi:AcrR family transcriptional regulator
LDAQNNSPVTLATESVRLPGARPGRDPSRAIKRGPSRVPPEVVAATQRERLFDALAQTVARKGYTAARVSDICDAAGVTRPAFYALFEGKEDAFLATYRYGSDVVLDAMGSVYREAGDWRDGVRAALGILLKILASVPAFAVMAIVEIDAVGPAGRLERDRLLRCFAPFFADAPRPALPGPDELADSIVGGIYSTIYRYVAQGRAAELPNLLPLLTYFALAPFVGREEAERQLAEDSGDEMSRQRAPKICRRENTGR